MSLGVPPASSTPTESRLVFPTPPQILSRPILDRLQQRDGSGLRQIQQNRQPSDSPPAQTPQTGAEGTGSMAQEILVAHNRYRAEVNVPPLSWSNALASGAQQWADHLASLGGQTIFHSESEQGENIWRGTAGAYSYTQMVDLWGSEQQYFVYGTFPQVSTTGGWQDVGHYTQIIWRQTQQVGCGLQRAGGFDIFVCRYSPPGNYHGQQVY